MPKKRKEGNRRPLPPLQGGVPATEALAEPPVLPAAAATRAPLATGTSRFEAVLASSWLLPAILVLAALVRLAHVLALSTTPFFDNLGLDPLVYDEWGQRIAAGDWLGSRIFYQDPLYPYFLGVMYAVFGRHLMLVYLVQVAFGVGTCWLTGLLGRRIFSKAAGNLAALMSALFVPSIFYEVQIEKTFLSVFLVAAFLVLVLDKRTRARAGAGAVLALATLTRANLIVFIPVSIGVLLFERLRGRSGYDFVRLPEEHGLRQAGAFLAGALLLLSPIAVRNWYVEGQWVLTTSQAGQNFYIGNNPLNTTGSYYVPPSIRPDPRYEETDFRAEAEKQTGRKLTPSEISDWWMDQAWKHMRSEPTFAQMMFLRKFILFWNDYEVPDNLNMYLLERWSWVLRTPLLGIGLITALAVLGAAVTIRERVEVRVLVGFIALYCATVVAFYVFSRYRIQIVPALIVLASWAILWMAEQIRQRRWDTAGGGAAAIVMTGFFCFQSFDWTDKPKAIAISLNNLGALYMQLGNTPKAIETYEEAVALSPQGVIGAMRILGDYYAHSGDLARAEQLMRQVVTYKPESQMGWNALSGLYRKRKDNGDTDPQLDEKLAGALLSAGRPGDSRRVIEEAKANGKAISAELEQRLAAAEARKYNK